MIETCLIFSAKRKTKSRWKLATGTKAQKSPLEIKGRLHCRNKMRNNKILRVLLMFNSQYFY